MSDIYVPGVKSRFDTEKLIQDLMRLERIPRDRAEKNVSSLQTEKTYWQDLGQRMTSLRESSRLLYSFQNPFNERAAVSSDESVLSATATREASTQEHSFIVKETAGSDRFLSTPLDESFRVEPGNYTFNAGPSEVTLNFRGGSLKEFTDELNRRGTDLVKASLISVQRGTRSLLIEAIPTGTENRLGFSGAAEKLALETGLVEGPSSSRRSVPLNESTVKNLSPDPALTVLNDGVLRVAAGGQAAVPLDGGIQNGDNLYLSFEALTQVLVPGGTENPGGADTRELVSLTFTDGTTAKFPALDDFGAFKTYRYKLSDLTGGKTIASIDITNPNSLRDVSIKDIQVSDSDTPSGLKPRNAVSTARDATVIMDGIEISRPSNTIDDLIPGLTVTLRNSSERPVQLSVESDRESVKEAVISMVGNYNRLMAEINVLTRNDDRIIQELTYLSADEQKSLRDRMGTFSADSSLNQLKAGLQQAAAAPYPTSTFRDPTLLSQIGIGTDVRRAGSGTGYDPARMRGYLEIDEKTLDAAIADKLQVVQQLFGFDTDGDLIVDSGLGVAIDRLIRPYMETGGLIALKTGNIDSRISQEERRMETMDRQLANKESSLKNQYGQMEEAYNRMESMSSSLDQFSQRSNNNQ